MLNKSMYTEKMLAESENAVLRKNTHM